MSLYYSQEKELRKDLAKLFNSQKPQVKALVDVFEKNENQKPNIRVLYKTLMQSYREIAFASIDTFVPILGSLNKKQVKEFFEKQVERTSKLKEKKNFSKRFEKSLVFLIGDLSPGQKKTIEQKFVPHLKSLNQARIFSREQTFERMKQIMSEDAPVSYREKQLKKVFQGQVDKLINNNSRDAIVKELEEFAQNISLKQKESLRKRLNLINDWLKEFIETKY